tara:strand:+ start:457 stop:576 length:120 start_codon:yes stop_codon:yes gene_type:complete
MIGDFFNMARLMTRHLTVCVIGHMLEQSASGMGMVFAVG